MTEEKNTVELDLLNVLVESNEKKQSDFLLQSYKESQTDGEIYIIDTFFSDTSDMKLIKKYLTTKNLARLKSF